MSTVNRKALSNTMFRISPLQTTDIHRRTERLGQLLGNKIRVNTNLCKYKINNMTSCHIVNFVLSYCNFCIYTHSVNSKFTI